MARENYTPGHRAWNSRTERRFDYFGRPNCGFVFECNEDGTIDTSKMHPAAQENLRLCLDPSNPLGVEDKGVHTMRWSYWEPGNVKCSCGQTVWLHSSLANQCVCGTYYNGCGQELSDPSTWEPEDRYDTFGPQNVKDPEEVG